MAVDMIAALDRLRTVYPVGPVKVEIECWDHGDRRLTSWSAWISVDADPSRGGHHVYGHSLDEVLAKVEAEQIPPTKDCEVIVDGLRVDPVPVVVADPDDDVPF